MQDGPVVSDGEDVPTAVPLTALMFYQVPESSGRQLVPS